MNGPKWLVLTWRLPAASSTPRVATWRSLRRLGAVILTPGAVILPFSEQLLEQLEWIAEDIVQRDGDAYVLPVTELSEAEEEEVRRRMTEERREEYSELTEAAQQLAHRIARGKARTEEPLENLQLGRELAALQRRFESAVGRDHFSSSARSHAERAIERALSAHSSPRGTRIQRRRRRA